MQYKGLAIMGIGTAKGDNAAQRALENAIKSPLLDEISLSGAQGIMIHWTVSPKVSMFALSNIMENIHNTIDGDAYVIFGTTTDNTLAADEVKITIVATGFQDVNSQTTQPSTQKVSETDTSSNSNNYSPNDQNYYDTPPSMRGYSIKYSLED
jgi:cell division protein FtsZ